MDITDNILSLIDKTPDSLMSGIAERVKQRRLEKGWTQKMLAAKAGLSLASYRRFESLGEIPLRSLVMLAFALDMTDEFETLVLFNFKTIGLLVFKNGDNRLLARFFGVYAVVYLCNVLCLKAFELGGIKNLYISGIILVLPLAF